MRTAILTLLVVLVLVATASAQNGGPALVTRDQGDYLRLAKVDVDVHIVGCMAETKMTLVFANPEGRDREGDLLFPVPEGASVCGYALDINGKMIDGVFVEAQQARWAYESIVRRKTDPALLELVKGNIFRARVFPIPANGTRTVAVRYIKDLNEAGEDLMYRLPLTFKDKLDEFHLRLEVAGASAEPKVLTGRPVVLEFIRKSGGFVAEATLKDKWLTDPLVIALPRKDALAPIVEKGPDGKVYFCIHCPAPAPAAPPKRVTILWDASGSRAGLSHERELNVLALWLAQFPKSEIAVDLIVFRHRAEPAQHFVAVGGRCEKLLQALAAVDYDGGTRLASLTPAAAPPERPDLYLLFTDGISSFDPERARELPAMYTPGPRPADNVAVAGPADKPGRLGAPIYVFMTGELKDPAVLGQLVKQDGGSCFDLDEMRGVDILARMARPGIWLEGATVTAGKVADLCPAKAQFIEGEPVVAGRLEGDEAAVTVCYGRARGDLAEVKYTVSARGAAEGHLAKFLWATQKVADLQAAAKPDVAEIVKVSKDCGVVTEYTSLIVLDTLDQYLQYRIRPPDMLPDMQRDYDKQVPVPQSAPTPPAPPVMPEPPPLEKYHPDPHEQPVYNALVPWYYRLSLWDEEYKYPPDFKYKAKEKDYVSSGGVGIEFGTRIYSPVVGEAAAGFASAFGGSLGGGGGGGGGLGGLFTVPGGAPEAGPAPAAPPVIDGAGVMPGTDAAAPASTGESVRPGSPIVVTPGAKVDDSYLKDLAAAPPEKQWAVYMAARAKHADSGAFFLECADFFMTHGQDDRSLQVASNLAELDFPESLRMRAMRLLFHNRPDMATAAFEEALTMEPNAADAYNLALLMEKEGKLERAAELLLKVTVGSYGLNFMPQGQDILPALPGIETVALADLNRLIPRLDAAAVKRLRIDRRLIHRFEGDLRVVITWDSEDDVDLSVTEPSGEKCYYDHALTTIGGQLWMDCPMWGPEEYCLRRAMPGAYKIEVGLAPPDSETGTVSMERRREPLESPALVRVDIYTDFGRAAEKHEVKWVELKEIGRSVTVEELKMGSGPPAAAPAGTR